MQPDQSSRAVHQRFSTADSDTMTKKSDALAASVARISTKFMPIGSFIYCRNPILMLRGFAFDMPPGGCYIWKYYFPLFGDVDFIHMSLGYRIQNGYIETKGKDIKQITYDAIGIINDYDDFSNDESLEDMISFSKNYMVSPIERSKLYKDMECFRHESFEDILARAATNQEKIGLAG